MKGHTALGHEELCHFYTVFIDSVSQLTKEPSRLQDPAPLPFLTDYPQLDKMPNNIYAGLKTILFTEMADNKVRSRK